MQEAQTKDTSLILAEIAGTWYGLRSSSVRYIEMFDRVTEVPNVPAFVAGVVFSRGQVIPAVDMRACFGLERGPWDLRTRLLVVQIGDRSLGLIVDSAREFVRVAQEDILPVPTELAEMGGRYLEGVLRLGERLVLLLDLGTVLESAGSGSGVGLRTTLDLVQAEISRMELRASENTEGRPALDGERGPQGP